MSVVEINNDLRKAYSKERDEVVKVLTQLSGEIAPFVEALNGTAFSLAINGCRPLLIVSFVSVLSNSGAIPFIFSSFAGFAG